MITVTRRLKLDERVCAQCGKPFMGWGRQRFCSTKCQKLWDYYLHAEARKAGRRERYRRQRSQVSQSGGS